MPDIPAAAAVVPGAELKFGEQLAGQIFHGIDQAHVGVISAAPGNTNQAPDFAGFQVCIQERTKYNEAYVCQKLPLQAFGLQLI